MYGVDLLRVFVITTLTACNVYKFTDRSYISFCLNQPECSKLCMASEIQYLECGDTVESLGIVRDASLDITKDPWVNLVGETDWAKLNKIGTIFKNTRGGAALEAERVGAPDGADLEFFSHVSY